ncbi:MAG: hypothetical protein JWQ09_1610 [Segetibacter sp.]|nr:hypothetical protein [Segetibacter sp.]
MKHIIVLIALLQLPSFFIYARQTLGLSDSTNLQQKNRKITIDTLPKINAVYLIEKESKKSDSKENIWELIPEYTSLIQTAIWILVVVAIYLAGRKKINEIAVALIERIRKGSSIEAGFLKVGEAPDLITSTKQFAEKESTEKFYGNPDHFITLFKVVSKDLKKSTKAMRLEHGCLIQVTTERRAPSGEWNISEAITFIPNTTVVKDNAADYAGRENEIGYHLEYKD